MLRLVGTQVRVCAAPLEELPKLECNRSRLSDSKHRWSLKETLELDRLVHLWFKLRCAPYCTAAYEERILQTDAQRKAEQGRRRRIQTECRGALDLARVLLKIGGHVHCEWLEHCSAWDLDFVKFGMEDLELRSTVIAGCALGVKHTVSRRLVGQRWRSPPTDDRLLDRLTIMCQGEHQHHEAGHHFRTFGVFFPDALARRACRDNKRKKYSVVLLLLLTWMRGGLTKEGVGRKATARKRRNPRSQPATLPVEPDVSKKELDLLNRHLQSTIGTNRNLTKHYYLVN